MKSLSIKLCLILFLYYNFSSAQNYIEQLNHIKNLEPVEVNAAEIHKAYFASGCFWCVEAIYESIIGVNEVISGYSRVDIFKIGRNLLSIKIT